MEKFQNFSKRVIETSRKQLLTYWRHLLLSKRWLSIWDKNIWLFQIQKYYFHREVSSIFRLRDHLQQCSCVLTTSTRHIWNFTSRSFVGFKSVTADSYERIFSFLSFFLLRTGSFLNKQAQIEFFPTTLRH